MATAPPLRRIVDRFLKDFDPIMAEDQVPLDRRALRAAMFFAEELVTDASGGAIKDPIGQPWFDAIHFEIVRWYAIGYREAMSRSRDGMSSGVVLLRGVPLSCSFPLVVVMPGSEPSNRRIYFPTRLRYDEKPLAFLDAKVSVRRFTKAERAELEDDITSVIQDTRRLNQALRFATVCKKGQQLANRAMWTIGNAVESIVAGSPARLGLAVWEVNLLAELSLKVFLHSQSVLPRKTHAVRSLYKDAVEVGLTPFDPSALLRFPSERSAIRFRYGERTAPSAMSIVALYRASLSLALHAAAHCKRAFSFQHDAWIEVRTVGARARG